MNTSLRIYIYPHRQDDPFANVLLPIDSEPGGNYASESYFKKVLMSSHFITEDPSEADLFFLPFSIARLRHDPRWGADHFYVACHLIGRAAMEKAEAVKFNAIQIVCSSSYYVFSYVAHKDASLPQIWPRQGDPPNLARERSRLAFFAGSINSPVREKLLQVWQNDSEISVHLNTSYSEELLQSKFCLHVKGFEVNTARIGDALYYGCVPVIVANHYDLPFQDILNWRSFSVIVATLDIPLLKKILDAISVEEYLILRNNVLKEKLQLKAESKIKKPGEAEEKTKVEVEVEAKSVVPKHEDKKDESKASKKVKSDVEGDPVKEKKDVKDTEKKKKKSGEESNEEMEKEKSEVEEGESNEVNKGEDGENGKKTKKKDKKNKHKEEDIEAEKDLEGDGSKKEKKKGKGKDEEKKTKKDSEGEVSEDVSDEKGSEAKKKKKKCGKGKEDSKKKKSKGKEGKSDQETDEVDDEVATRDVHIEGNGNGEISNNVSEDKKRGKDKKQTKDEKKQRFKEKYNARDLDKLRKKLDKINNKIESLLEKKEDIMRLVKEAEDKKTVYAKTTTKDAAGDEDKEKLNTVEVA
ncbi:hypothetical protein SASPL_102076 [Salvia splendens]|uniref:Exostosin GT47 domain-containing protein n=1 Tax=Salvia splendens TaxID=180675 RepID=A0A8X8YW19_SALSN|nr:hypothetical protein SASPL_102076 [Salvia splendens]